jgi:hypothetical protein
VGEDHPALGPVNHPAALNGGESAGSLPVHEHTAAGGQGQQVRNEGGRIEPTKSSSVSMTRVKFAAELCRASKTTVTSGLPAGSAYLASWWCRRPSPSIIAGDCVTSGWFPG